MDVQCPVRGSLDRTLITLQITIKPFMRKIFPQLFGLVYCKFKRSLDKKEKAETHVAFLHVVCEALQAAELLSTVGPRPRTVGAFQG